MTYKIKIEIELFILTQFLEKQNKFDLPQRQLRLKSVKFYRKIHIKS